jgi:cobalt-zinc-cadmium efflux system membrane fusion protein
MLALSLTLFLGCEENSNSEKDTQETKASDSKETKGHNEEEGGMRSVHLSEMKFNSLGIKLDTLPKKALSGIVEANGQLEVPPQYEATVTAVLGGNINSIKVIEGDKVNKGQILAYLSHPTLTKIQTDYINAYNRMQFLEKEFARQKRLYEAEVGSGKSFQQTQADYQSVQGEVRGYESQLRQLNLSVSRVRNGELYEYIPVVSPIEGYIEKVKVQIGQYVEPQTSMFMVVDNEHVHADLMVFEKDIYKVKEGQQVRFSVQSRPGTELVAEIYSVGKTFEQDPKAVHVHAEIENKGGGLIPGMYIKGRIEVDNDETAETALPESAIITEGGRDYVFKAQREGNTWSFIPVEVTTGEKDGDWIAIRFFETPDPTTHFAFNNAYYLMGEMKKGELGDDD